MQLVSLRENHMKVYVRVLSFILLAACGYALYSSSGVAESLGVYVIVIFYCVIRHFQTKHILGKGFGSIRGISFYCHLSMFHLKKGGLFVGWLLNVPATSYSVSQGRKEERS